MQVFVSYEYLPTKGKIETEIERKRDRDRDRGRERERERGRGRKSNQRGDGVIDIQRAREIKRIPLVGIIMVSTYLFSSIFGM